MEEIEGLEKKISLTSSLSEETTASLMEQSSLVAPPPSPAAATTADFTAAQEVMNTAAVAAAAAIMMGSDNENKKIFNEDRNLSIRKELPIKEAISLVDIEHMIENKPNIAENVMKAYSNCVTYEDRASVRFEHNEKEFYVFCACQSCLEYREVILKLILDLMNSRIMWGILRRDIKRFYQSIVEKAPSCVGELYENLFDDPKFSWFPSGTQSKIKQSHSTFLWDIWLTETMRFLLFTTLLMDEDPHQLFELLCYQVECFVKAYAEGVKVKLDSKNEEKCPVEEILIYILKGYTEMCKVAEGTAGFLFAFERTHLEQFSLSWILINKRMYQKYVYGTFSSKMPDCIIRLKNEVSHERFTELIKEYIKFDEEMTEIQEKWKDVWITLNEYHMSSKDQERRKRILSIKKVFESIQREISVPFVQFINIPDWGTHPDRAIVWQNLVAYLKEHRPPIDEKRLNAIVCEERCKNCNQLLEYHKSDCICVSCLIAGGPDLKISPDSGKHNLCSKCAFMGKVSDKMSESYSYSLVEKCRSLNEKNIDNKKAIEKKTICLETDIVTNIDVNLIEEESGRYHLSWAVFQHLKDRKPYPFSTVDSKYFCSNCKRTACLLAKKFLNKEIAFALAHPLLKHYQPLSMTLDKLVETVSCAVLYTQKAISTLYVPSQDMICKMHDDVVLNILGILINSAVASYFADAESDIEPDLSTPQVEHLEIINGDIQLPVRYLEKNMKSKKFLDFFGKTLGMSLSDEEENSMSQNSLKEAILEEIKNIAPEINFTEESSEIESKCEATNETELELEIKTEPKLPPVEEQPSCPQLEQKVSTPPGTKMESPKHKKSYHIPLCCADHLNSKERDFKEKLLDAIDLCYHEKECSHVRISEARDRLRRKLNQLASNKKNARTLNRNLSKSPLEIIKNMNKNSPTVNTATSSTSPPREIGTKNCSKSIVSKDEKPKQVISKESKATNTPLCNEEVKDNVNLDEWIKDTLSFIEGKANTKKNKNSVNNKKAAKKAKQKLKKEEVKRVEELHDFRSQFHDLYFKEFTCKNELKTQRTLKKKDKKKINELENNIKKLSRAKSKIETHILELIGIVKTTNSEFKFPYLPTKEQQQQILEKLNAPKNVLPGNNVRQVSKTQEKSNIDKKSVHPKQTHQQQQQQQRHEQQYPIFEQHPNISFSYGPSQPANSTTDCTDPSKRIVTIRRVNLPNIAEPQVTVTAKGASPDKDKLLYTFINGQLVPANIMDPDTLRVLEGSRLRKSGSSHSRVPEKEEHLHVINKKVSLESNTINVPTTKSKTQLKKERKKAKKCALEEQKAIKDLEEASKVQQQQQQSITKKNNKVVDKVVQRENIKDKGKDKINNSNNLNVDNKTKVKINMKSQKLSENSQNTKVITATNLTSKHITKPEKSSKPQAPMSNPPLNKNEEKKVEKKTEKEKHRKVIDNGQFDNNQFKMLHMDEFSSETDESISENNLCNENVQVLEYNNEKKNNKQNKSNKTKNKTVIKGKNKQMENVSVKQNKKDYDKLSSDDFQIKTTKDEVQPKKQTKKANNSQDNNKNKKNSSNKMEKNSDKVTKSLQNSMQKLHISSKATNELEREHFCSNISSNSVNISIMEQLNRGVQVENLTLPPGITLTKVDPKKAETLRAKTESIGKLSQPLQSQAQPNVPPPPIISPALLPHLGRYSQNQSGVIMVDAMQNRGDANTSVLSDGNKKSKRNKRKGKKKSNDAENRPTVVNSKEPKMITLRNPMFHGPGTQNPMLSMANRMPVAPVSMDQPAAIIKNENGMFTIRNPALHQAVSNGMPGNYRQYCGDAYTMNDVNTRNFSYFSDNATENSSDQQFNCNSDSNNSTGRISAIGSEIKNAQQQKKIGNHWNSVQTPQNVAHSSLQQKYQQSNYYEVFPYPSNSNRTGEHHNCDDSPPPSITSFNHYLNGISNNTSCNKYDDMSFLRNLYPGQKLNSEVTIHNINESKFSANNSSPHRIDITPISRSSSSSSSKPSDYILNLQQQQQQHYQQQHKNYNLGRRDFLDGSALYHPPTGSSTVAPSPATMIRNETSGNPILNANSSNIIDHDVNLTDRFPSKPHHFNYDFDPLSEKQRNSEIHLNELLSNSRQNISRSVHDESSLDNFVHNMNALKISPGSYLNGPTNSNSSHNSSNDWW